jgi:hypothetical protein
MTIEGVDFSYDRPGGAALAAAGKHFVVRYITGAGGKALTAAEISDYHAHGISIALVFESTRGRVLGGRPAGIADATQAVAACTALHIPSSTRIYFAVDFDAQPRASSPRSTPISAAPRRSSGSLASGSTAGSTSSSAAREPERELASGRPTPGPAARINPLPTSTSTTTARRSTARRSTCVAPTGRTSASSRSR